MPESQVGELPEARATRPGPAIVDARDEIALLGEHLIPQVRRPTPRIEDRLRAGTSVHVHQERVALGGVEVPRLDDQRVQLHSIRRAQLQELRRLEAQRRHLPGELGVVRDRPDEAAVSVVQPLDHRHADARVQVDVEPSRGVELGVRATGRERDHEPDRARGIVLRLRGGRRHHRAKRENGGEGLAAQSVHSVIP